MTIRGDKGFIMDIYIKTHVDIRMIKARVHYKVVVTFAVLTVVVVFQRIP